MCEPAVSRKCCSTRVSIRSVFPTMLRSVFPTMLMQSQSVAAADDVCTGSLLDLAHIYRHI